MAKIKRKVWEGRAFLNTINKSCIDAVSWRVEVRPGYGKYEGQATWCAEFTGPNEGYMYAETKDELRYMQILQREINKFNDAVEEAITMAEEYNAASKEPA